MYNYNNPKNKPRLCLFAKKWGLQSKPRLVCLLSNWGPHRKPRFYLFAMGEKLRYELPQ